VRPCDRLQVLDSDFGKYFASSGFSRVHQLEEVDAFVRNTGDIFFDGIDAFNSSVMSTFDLHVSDSAPTHCAMIWVRSIARSRRNILLLALSIVSPISCDRSGDSATKYYARDLDVFDRVLAPLGLSSRTDQASSHLCWWSHAISNRF
jgi:hypothetical protein